MRVVVTGGAGFVGSSVVRAMRADGYRPIVIDDLSGDSTDADLARGPDFHRLDIRRTADLTALCAGADVIVHLASSVLIRGGHLQTRRDLEQVVVGTHSVLDAARLAGVRHICFASSAAVYGEQPLRPTPESVELRPRSLYGAAKAAAEQFLLAYSALFPLTVTIFRFGNVLGPGLRRGVVHDFTRQMLAGTPALQVLGDGRQQKSYLWIDDCVRGILALGVRDRSPVTFNLAAGETVSVTRIARLVAERGGIPDLPIRYVGGTYGWPGDVPVLELSSERAASRGWRAEESAEGAVRRCIDANWSGAGT